MKQPPLDHDGCGRQRPKESDAIDLKERDHASARKAGPGFRRPALVVALAATLGGLAAATLPGFARGEEGPDPPPLEVIADAVLIDAHCRSSVVDMGVLFEYGARHGLTSADILPLGSLREAFEATLARRSAAPELAALCTSTVAREKLLAPGVVKAP